MNKIYLILAFLSGALVAVGQTGVSGPQEIIPSGTAINVSVFGLEETEADGYFADAEKNERRGDLNEALNLFGKAAFEYNSDKKLHKYAGSLLRISNIHLLMSHYVEAEQVILNAALKTYVKIGSKSGQMASYGQLGKIYLAANKLTQSLWFYSQQGILAKQLKNNTAYIDSVLGSAAVKIKKKDYQLALKDVNNAEQLAKLHRITQFNTQIKNYKTQIAEKKTIKKV